MFERFTDRARRVVVLAQEEARGLDHDHVGTEHILLGLIHEGEGVAAKALESLGISPDAVRQQVEEIIGRGQQAPSGHIPFTPRAKKVLELALREALQFGHNYIGTEHILLGLIREDDGVAARVLIANGAYLSRAREMVGQLLHGYYGTEPAPAGSVVAVAPPSPSVLNRFGRNLTQSAREVRLDPVVGRENEIERIMQVLSRRTQNSPVLVGEPGVGKTAVVAGLAQKIVKGQVPPGLAGKEIYALDPRTGTSGSRAEILEEIRNRGDIIIFLDRLPTPTGDGAARGADDLGSVFKPLLVGGELQIIGEMTSDEYRDYLARDPAAERRFQPVQVAEPTVSLTVEMLKALRDRYEAHHRVSITEAALAAAAELADQHLPGRRLPSKAVDLIDEAASLVHMRRQAPPPDLREYDEAIARVRRDKESAIDSQDWDKAAELRDTEKQLLAKKAAREKEWKADMDVVTEVNEQHVAEALAVMSGLPLEATASEQRPEEQSPPFPPAAMTGDDREIWAMS